MSDETRAEREARQEREHREKYEALACKLGIGALLALVPVSKERVLAAIASGDEHLNSIPLAMWDRAALGAGNVDTGHTAKCPCCGHRKPRVLKAGDWPAAPLRETARREPWRRAPGLSLAERVCVLKHVALFHTDHLPT